MGEINFTRAFFGLLFAGGAGLLWHARRRDGGGRTLPLTADWIEELSTERYRPMLRLLDPEDLAFLRAQPRFDSRQEARFRNERAKIFQGYLRCLETDFQRMTMAIRLFMVHSRADRPDLAGALVRHQAAFAVNMALVHARLFLYRCGVCGIDSSGLMRSFEAVRVELRALAPAGAKQA